MNGVFLNISIIVGIVFIARIIRIWIKEHYASKKNQNEDQAEVETENLKKLSKIALKLEDRIKSLESILDKDLPEWRNRR